MKKDGNKEVFVIMISLLVVMLLVASVSAGLLDKIKRAITGDATQTVQLNISVGVPQIQTVYNSSLGFASGPNEAPAITDVIVNFSVYNPSGAGNLNHSTALANISSGSEMRQNASCQNIAASGDYANYTCNITMYWYDTSGTWAITAYIEDNQTNSALNTSTDFYVGQRTAFVMGPSILTWASIGSGATNQTSNNDPLLLNNTGNDIIAVDSITINSSNLRGETIPTEGLWAGNFSSHWATGGSCVGAACTECGGSVMARSAYTAVTGSNLSKGDYTINDGDTGQEELYFCLRLAGSELSTQAYSTANETEWNWIVQIA
ncbi:MAG: hypothetical protein ABIB79_00470 [archaeon]